MKFSSVTVIFFYILAVSCSNKLTWKTHEINQFEGVIKYKIEYRGANGSAFDEMNLKFGDIITYTWKDSMYMSRLSNHMTMIELYNGGDSIFTKIDKNTFSIPITNHDNDALHWKHIDTKEEVMGIKCCLFRIYTDVGTIDYYYNSEIGLEPSFYSNHYHGYRNICSIETKSIALKYVEVIDQDTFITSAIKIEPKAINVATFNLN